MDFLEIVKSLSEIDDTLASGDYNLKVAAYSDQRVSPTGIDSLEGRLSEAEARYRDRPGSSMNNPRTKMLIECALKVREADYGKQEVFIAACRHHGRRGCADN